METSNLRLTQTVKKGGCAAKLSVNDLRTLLAPLTGKTQRSAHSPNLLIDGGTFDDAAVLRWPTAHALVQTLDFFTPIVDTPETFGKIASANALSDVYAMGGEPVAAMAILAFPLSLLSLTVGQEVMLGCAKILTEAETPLVGGHTIDDDTLKFGLSVSGRVSEDRILSNQKAEPGQALILTKPLGTGTACAALKQGETTEAGIAEEITSMCTLNKFLDLLGDQAKFITAATDITGFGLLGHSLHIARESHVSLEIYSQQVPLFANTLRFLEGGFLTKAHRTNWEAAQAQVSLSAISEKLRQAFVDPQTSGGLLLSVAADQAPTIVQSLRRRFPNATQIGFVREHKPESLVQLI